MANYPQVLAQDAVCQSHTGHMTGLWFLPAWPLRLNTNEWMNTINTGFAKKLRSMYRKRPNSCHVQKLVTQCRNWWHNAERREPHCTLWWAVNYIHKWNTSRSHKLGRKTGLGTQRCSSSWFSSHHQAKVIILTEFSLIIVSFFLKHRSRVASKLTFWTDHNTSKLVQSSPVLGMCSDSKAWFVVLTLSLVKKQDFRDVTVCSWVSSSTCFKVLHWLHLQNKAAWPWRWRHYDLPKSWNLLA